MEAQLEEELRIRGPLLKVPTIVFQQVGAFLDPARFCLGGHTAVPVVITTARRDNRRAERGQPAVQLRVMLDSPLHTRSNERRHASHASISGGRFLGVLGLAWRPLSLYFPPLVCRQMLCTEFHRCEQVLVEAAATLFKKYDYNSNGMQEYKELCDVVKQMQSEMGEEYDEVDPVTLILFARDRVQSAQDYAMRAQWCH